MYKPILSIILVTLCCSACDSGDIVERTIARESNGHTVKLTAHLSGMTDLSSNYSLSLAAFRADDNYAITIYNISSTLEDGNDITLVMPNIEDEVSTVELAITNRLRQRVFTLARVNMDDYAESSDTIRMEVGMVDVGMFNVIQQNVFNMSCIQCHGGNGGSGAAGLNMTEGNAQSQLVDVPSTRQEGMFRVVSGSASQSLLHQILAEGGEGILHYNHTEVLSSRFKDDVIAVRTFIDDWINALTVEN